MYQLAKSAREKMKAKARALASPGTLAKGQDTTQASWSPAEALNADVKTGMRPLSKRAYKDGGKVSGASAKTRADRKPRKSGGGVEKSIGVGMANKNMKEANESREGVKHVGGFKKGGRAARATGGSVPSDKETLLDKDRVGTIQVKPKRKAASHYKKGGRTKKEGGGFLENIGNALMGRGYIDGSTWLKKDEPVTASDTVEKISPAQYAKERAMARQNMRTTKTPRMSKEQASRELAMGRELQRNADIMPGAKDTVQSDRFMKKGGKIKKADGGYAGGSLPSPEEAVGSEERLKGLKVMPGKSSTSAAQVTPAQLRREEGYSAADMKAPRAGRKDGGKQWIQSAIEKPGALRKAMKVKEGEKIPAKKLEKAAEQPGKMGKRARLAMTLKRMNRATGGATLLSAMKGAAKKVSKKGGKTDINIVINAGKAPRPEDMKPPMGMGAMPPPDMGMAPPPPPAMPMGAPAVPPPPMGDIGSPAAAAVMGRKSGGRITKVASSYKDMEAGAASGEGRLQKTDIAKKHRDAPARKAGGRISKVAKSYKDMTAGAGSGEGRLQKEDIAKAKKDRAA